MYRVIYVIGVFQSKQIKTCAIVCRPYKRSVDFAPGRHFGESQPKKLKFLFSRNKKKGQRKFKHFRTASEIKSYQEHPQKHKPQQMITQCACNKPASWLLNVRLIVRQKRDLLSQNLDCYMHCVVRERKEENLCSSRLSRSRFALSRAYDVVFGLSTLIFNRILFNNLCEIEYPARRTLEHD